MNDQSRRELFAERPVRSDFGQPVDRSAFKRIATVGVLLLLIIGGISLCAAFFVQDNKQPVEIPTIKAETALKQKPEEPGGIDIPHQNVMVFQQLDNGEEKGSSVEHLLPQPETPLISETQKPEAPALVPEASAPGMAENLTAGSPDIDAPVQSAVSIPTTVAESVPTKVEPAPPAVIAAPAPVVSPAPVQPVKPAPTVVAMAKPTPAPKHETARLPDSMFVTGEVPASSAKAVTGGSAIQLASVQGQDAAQNYLKNVQSKYADTLNGVHLRLTRADLGSKGVFYRVQSEPMNEAQAKALCSKLKSRSAACILVHP